MPVGTAGGLALLLGLGLVGLARSADDAVARPVLTTPAVVVFTSDRSGNDLAYGVDPVTGRLAKLAAPWADHVAPSPAGDAIVFTSLVPTGLAVFVQRSGRQPIRLPGCDASTLSGSWSPDGTSVACSSTGGVLVDSADGASWRIAASGEVEDPSWSPDGSWIAFRGRAGVSVVPAGGGTTTVLTSIEADGPLSWSPDSTHIAFLTPAADFSSERLDVVALDGSGVKQLLRGVGDESDYVTAAWSPDGRSIAVGTTSGLALVDPASGAARRITGADGEWPVWSPDGAMLAFMRPRSSSSDTQWDIGLVDMHSGKVRLLTRAFPDGGTNVEPAWSVASLGQTLPQARVTSVRMPRVNELAVRGGIGPLAVGGERVAFTAGDCDTATWNGRSPVLPVRTCEGGCPVAPDLLTVSSARVAWACRQRGLDAYESIRVAGPSRTLHTYVAFLYADDTGGHEVDALDTAGSTLVFQVSTIDGAGTVLGRETYAFDPKRAAGRCPDDGGPESTGAAKGCRRLVLASGCTLLAAGGAAILESCAGSVLALDASGATVRSWQLHLEGTLSAAVDRRTVVILDGLDLRRYDLRSGTLLRERRLAPGIVPASLRGEADGIVAYRRGIALHLLRLADGRDRVVRAHDGSAKLDGGIVGAGLFYTYDALHGHPATRVAFAPMPVVRKALAR